ncbi:hypothetical protein V5799_019014 [Amblyomma americanum]|uniref:Uncharacterized protein n=1 Tax=Amblyomma americanum TaxID=6943 RepID=A0AAQ4EYE6_AMBAM
MIADELKDCTATPPVSSRCSYQPLILDIKHVTCKRIAGRGSAEHHAGGLQAPGPHHQLLGAAPAPRPPDRAAVRRGPALAGTAGPRCRFVAMSTHQAGDAPPRFYVSVVP